MGEEAHSTKAVVGNHSGWPRPGKHAKLLWFACTAVFRQGRSAAHLV